ncbi:MAG: DUF748 domain-containing protein [Candidatus Omnitrophota bacterium]
MKKLGIILLVFLVIFAGIIYYFRFEIFQHSAEAIVRKNLPPYVTVQNILFNLKEDLLEVKGLGIKNPKGYRAKDLATVGSITCRYKMKGKNILDGIKVTEIVTRGFVINIERLPDGRLNINEMDKVMETGKKAGDSKVKAPGKEGGKSAFGKDISDIIELTKTIDIRDGRVVFTDEAVTSPPYTLTFDNINGQLDLTLAGDYRSVNYVSSRGGGVLNGDPSQRINWVVSLDPKKERLTMSNRYEVSDLNVLLFRPYYDRYSPIDIKKCRVSGTLVFDFNSGNIGSMNTLRLSDLRFEVKRDASGVGFWEASIPEIIEYLRTSSGEIVFDFKIKGDMNNPRFYPGPHLKQAIQMKVVDTIADALAPKEEGQGGVAGKSDAEQVVDVFRELLKR